MFRYGPLLLVLLLACGDDPTPPSPPVPRDAGLADLNARIAATPDDPALYARRAQLYYERDNLVDATTDLEQAVRLDSTPNYAYALADVYLDAGRTEDAGMVLIRTIRGHPNNPETYLRLGEVQLILQQYQPAIENLELAQHLAPKDPEAYYLLAQVYAESGDTTQALASGREAVRLDPDMADAFLLLGELAEGQQDPRALDYYDTAVAIDPNDVVARHARAEYFMRQDDLPRAIREYRQLNFIDRQYVTGNLNAGLLLLQLDSLPQARAEFNIAVNNDPANYEAHYYRGYTNALLGDVTAARRDYETAIRLAPDFIPAREALDQL